MITTISSTSPFCDQVRDVSEKGETTDEDFPWQIQSRVGRLAERWGKAWTVEVPYKLTARRPTRLVIRVDEEGERPVEVFAAGTAAQASSTRHEAADSKTECYHKEQRVDHITRPKPQGRALAQAQSARQDHNDQPQTRGGHS